MGVPPPPWEALRLSQLVFCLLHQSVTPFLTSSTPPKKSSGRLDPPLRCEVFPFDFLCSGCLVFKMSLVLNTITLLIGDDTIYRPCHFSILYYQELWAPITTMPTSLLPYMSECFLNFWEGAAKRKHTRRRRRQKIIFKFNYCRLYSLSVFSLAKDPRVNFGNQRNLQDWFASFLQADSWLICRLQAHCMISEGNVKQDVCSVWR